jgi:hypothetical protein
MRAPPSTSTLRTARALFGARRRKIVLVVARLVQIVALVFAVQMSGVAHRVADLLFHDDCAAQCGHERSDDDDSECPPGCPTCHTCAHAQVPYVPGAPSLALPPVVTLVVPPDAEHFALPRGEVLTVFRPPRGSSSLTV